MSSPKEGSELCQPEQDEKGIHPGRVAHCRELVPKNCEEGFPGRIQPGEGYWGSLWSNSAHLETMYGRLEKDFRV